MSKFPALTYQEIVKKIRKAGFCFYRQAKGSYEVWVTDNDGRVAILSKHSGKVIKRKTLKDIIEATGLSANEFIKL